MLHIDSFILGTSEAARYDLHREVSGPDDDQVRARVETNSDDGRTNKRSLGVNDPTICLETEAADGKGIACRAKCELF